MLDPDLIFPSKVQHFSEALNTEKSCRVPLTHRGRSQLILYLFLHCDLRKKERKLKAEGRSAQRIRPRDWDRMQLRKPKKSYRSFLHSPSFPGTWVGRGEGRALLPLMELSSMPILPLQEELWTGLWGCELIVWRFSLQSDLAANKLSVLGPHQLLKSRFCSFKWE